MPRKQPIGPVHGIRDQVWLGQATSGGRRKKTERGGNTSRGKLLGPRPPLSRTLDIRCSSVPPTFSLLHARNWSTILFVRHSRHRNMFSEQDARQHRPLLRRQKE
uniref:Uncharacterized protein n=1 Tax=Caenorhabditis japonica TaxID=281687 RepID=A0A8R1IH26_CAEJA